MRIDSVIRGGPWMRHGTIAGMPAVTAFVLASVWMLLSAGLSSAQSVDQNLWATNGQVYAVARSGNTLCGSCSSAQPGSPLTSHKQNYHAFLNYQQK